MIRNKKSQKALELEQKLAIQEFAHANNAKYVAVSVSYTHLTLPTIYSV